MLNYMDYPHAQKIGKREAPMKSTPEGSRSRMAVLLFIFLLFSTISCTQREKGTYTIRKSRESLFLTAEEMGFAVDLFLLLDQSGSMKGYTGHPATDPEGLRIQASRYLIRNIAQKSTRDLPHRIGIINFGTTAPDDLMIPLTEITKAGDDAGTQKLASNLRILSLGDTSFIAALKAAYGGFMTKGTSKHNRKPVLIIFTDGEPDDPRKHTREKYFQEIEDLMASSLEPIGCDVYITGIDAAGATWSKSMPYWKRILPNRHVHQISSMSQLQERFNQAICQIFGIPPIPPEVVTPRGLEFEVPPYLEKIEFHIFPEHEESTLAIFGADGKAVTRSPQKVSIKEYEGHDIVTVSDPAYGKWRYQILEGEGEIEVYRNAIPVRMKLISPSTIHPLGKPMNLMASFRMSDGREIVEIPEFPIGLTAKVIAANDKEYNVRLMRGGKGICFGTPSVEDIEAEGIYRIILTIKGGDVYKSAQESVVQVKSMPYVMVDKPSSDSTLHFGEGLSIEASLLRNGKPMKPEEAFIDHPEVLILAQIVQTPGGDKSESVWLSPVPDNQVPGMFHGLLPVSLRQEVDHVLMTRLAGQLRSGENMPNEYNEVRFSVYPSFAQKSLGALTLALYIVGTVIAAISAVWLTWIFTLPRMCGHLYVYLQDSESGRLLTQKRLDRKKLCFIRMRKSGNAPAVKLWINRDRRIQTRVEIRRKFVSRPERLNQNASICIGGTHSVRYM